MSEWRFKRDTAFRKQFFVPDSFAHPAKMDAQLLIKIVEEYTQAGETILDPMAGSGTTMLACTLGRNCILVELEEKFCKMVRDNWEQVKMRPQLGSSMGKCQIIQGDARQLEGLVDKVITSPPWAEVGTDIPVTGRHHQVCRKDSTHTLEYVDKIVTSPPHGNSNVRRGDKAFDTVGAGESMEYGYTEGQLANLPYGEIDKCIFSPPYAENPGTPSLGSVNKDDWGKEGKDIVARRGLERGYSKDTRGQLGNLPYGQIDGIITSPPYEEGLGHGRGSKASKEILETKKLHLHGAGSYSEDKENIGEMKGQSYLQAMLQVYQQCHSVLKPQGLMILVTKNFIRNKQIVRLDTDTIKLCEQAGFSYFERHKRKLPSQSFWRVTYHKRHPEVEEIWHEDILVFRK